jgi:hypothetical protein
MSKKTKYTSDTPSDTGVITVKRSLAERKETFGVDLREPADSRGFLDRLQTLFR